MSTLSRVRNAFISASIGWFTAWVITLIWFTFMRVISKYPDNTSIGDEFSILTIYLVCTAAFTLLTTAVFIVPYVCVRSHASILGHPWRMYLEPCLIGLACITLFDIKEGAPIDTLQQKVLSLFVGFALVTSLASSFFFLRRMKRFQHRIQVNSPVEFDNNPAGI